MSVDLLDRRNMQDLIDYQQAFFKKNNKKKKINNTGK
jgi:hypothetical protein